MPDTASCSRFHGEDLFRFIFMQGKHIVLGITGSIAAYKACTLIRLLVKAGAEVQVVITPSGKQFITPLTLATLSRNAVVSEFFDRNDGSWHSHVDLGVWADLMLIAPASASTIGKMAHAIADNILLTTYLSMRAPIFVAPAMDLDMYKHPSTQANIERLRSFGNHIIEPAEGELASSLVGKGRMEEPEAIFEYIAQYFSSNESTSDSSSSDAVSCASSCASSDVSLSDVSLSSPMSGSRKKVLITAGPTHERIDPVRFLGNHSTGKMGFALAESCARQGWEVELVTGPVHLSSDHPLIRRTDVESAIQMHEAAIRIFPDCDVAILCAAVADFMPKQAETTKIKRETTGEWSMTLVPTPDIARELGRLKRSDQLLVGFALETNDEQKNAHEKLQRKNLDFIVLNSLRDKGAGFGGDTNKITIIDADGTEQPYPLQSKHAAADEIIRHLCKKLS